MARLHPRRRGLTNHSSRRLRRGLTRALGRMKRALLSTSMLLVGCATGVSYVAPSQPANVAVLLVKPADRADHPFAAGISQVDEAAYFRPPYPTTIFLTPGNHRIGFNCTKVISTGGPPTIEYKFMAGVTYHLACNGDMPAVSQGSVEPN